MKFVKTPIKTVFVIEMDLIEDDRGFFSRGWCVKEFQAHGLNAGIVQQNFGFSYLKGTLRGLHFQSEPYSEVKVVRCVKGSLYDVAVDMRRDSPTFMHWFSIELTAKNRKMLYLPEGIAHGYQTLEDNTEMYYFTTQIYAPDHASGLRYNDPKLGIPWPLPVSEISSNDQEWPLL